MTFWGFFIIQLTFLSFYLVWIIVFSPFYIFWIIIGIFFFQCKVLAIGTLWNFWFFIWTGTHEHDIDTLVDTSLLNEALLIHMVESLPQLTVQIWNTQLLGKWTVLGYFSTLLSSFISINGLYRYGYYLLWRGIHIDVRGMFFFLTDTVLELANYCVLSVGLAY